MNTDQTGIHTTKGGGKRKTIFSIAAEQWFCSNVSAAILLFFFLVPCVAQVDGAPTQTELVPVVKPPPLKCDPCIDRPSHKIKVIVHGIKGDPFWEQVKVSAMQAALDMRILLEMELYENESDASLNMANDILRTVQDQKEKNNDEAIIDALIVSIPTERVWNTIVTTQGSIPVFGMNSGYLHASSLLGFVGMDEYRGGFLAAEEFLSAASANDVAIKKALFLGLQEEDNTAIQQRLDGFKDGLNALIKKGNETVATFEIVVNDIKISGSSYDEQIFKGCLYDVVLVGSGRHANEVVNALSINGCNDIIVGTFDTEPREIYKYIAAEKIHFAISQNHFLQGSLAVVMATLYATTGKKLMPSKGMFSSGPNIIKLENLPVDFVQKCEFEGFPICNSNVRIPSSVLEQHFSSDSIIANNRCVCKDRKTITIAGVTHAVENNPFFDLVNKGQDQATSDMGINLVFEVLSLDDDDILLTKMAKRIRRLCDEGGIDGLFVTTVGRGELSEALQFCLNLKIPIVAINTGQALSKELNLMHYIAQDELVAGYRAGKEMIDAGMTRGYCLMMEKNNPALDDRCEGFKRSIQDTSNISFRLLDISPDNIALFEKQVEAAVSNSSNNKIENSKVDWEGVGLLSIGRTQPALLSLKLKHPEIVAGAFDTSEDIYAGLDDGRLLFGIDQEPYLQGYFPIVLLTWFIQTKQRLNDFLIPSGPEFFYLSPTEDAQDCENVLFDVCPIPENKILNQINAVRPFGFILLFIVCSTAVGFVGWVVKYWEHRIVKASQPIFLLMICTGTIIMALTVIPLSIDDSIATENVCSTACMASPWFVSLGFSITFAALFSKISRINQLISLSKGFKRVKITEKDVLKPFIILMMLNLIILVLWTFLDPLKWKRDNKCGVEALNTYGHCTHNRLGFIFACCAAIINVVALFLANFEAYKARKIRVEYGESKYVGMVMMSIMQVAIIGVPIFFMVDENPIASYFVRVCIIFIICMSTLMLIFIPKLKQLKKNSGKSNSSNMRIDLSSKASTNDDTYGMVCSVASEQAAKHVEEKIKKLKNIMEERGIENVGGLLVEAGIKVTA